ncbi:MAG: class IIb bacteriocin, lactobin A/cerein 7B family [Prevotellaceae bacterium]|jgi:lactobin A/cerein 7B family class IIb bacteriocin|nr:class IIb bacteriocin, lactobin A/cerein 7B family [Prevotellaceae bacterium]
MAKKFELSAYGVEEMNQKELVNVEGGLHPLVWMALGWLVDGAVKAATGSSLTDLCAAAIEETANATMSAAAYARDGCHDKR